MNIEEAKWIRSKIGTLSPAEITPVLNIGSSTREFRVEGQPYIDSEIFGPLRRQGVQVIHQDIKHADGVDLVGDLTDQRFLEEIVNIRPHLILCNNLLEHLENREPFIKALCSIIPPHGHLILTVPSEFPKHMDPIDTMYRPTATELAELFPNMQVLDSRLIDIGTTWELSWDGFRKLLRILVRSAIPFIKHKGWVTAIHKLRWLFKQRRIACVFLRNQ